MLKGLVIRSQSGFYTVRTESQDWTCQLRGRLKHGRRLGDVVAVGDWVQITPTESPTGIIESVEPRQRIFSRLAPNPQGEYEQILIANPDLVVLVFSCAHPAPRLGMIDRYLVTAEKRNLPVLIVANKADLVTPEEVQRQFGHYPALDYGLLPTSAIAGQGVAELQAILNGKISLFTGPSGVGKTSLLNALQPGLGLEVRKVSRVTRKGRHTTVVREMFPLAGGGFVADTPGWKALALVDIRPEELDGYFPEFRQRVMDCQFNDCTHMQEPGCAIRQALDEGLIHPERYRSYVNMRFGDLEE